MANLQENTGVSEFHNTDPRSHFWPTYAPPADPVFTSAQGTKLYTEDNAEYLDFISGIAVTSFGHCHPHLIKALAEQASKAWHLSNLFRVTETERLSHRLCEHSFGEKVFFTNSGTEATEAGFKALRGHQYAIGQTQRHRIIAMTGSFHGRTMAPLAASGNKAHMEGFIPFDYGFDQAEWGDLDSVESKISNETAGIVVEPIQGEGGIRVASKEFLQGLRALCDKYGLLLMYDEVQSGAGRSGKLFAYELTGVAPDVMALAKGIGGGFPLGACIATEEVGSSMSVGKHGSTFGGNPLAAAVGNAVMDLLLEETLFDEVSRKGRYFAEKLNDLVAEFPNLLAEVSGAGLMIGVRCHAPNLDLLKALRENHLLVGRAGCNMLRFLPPLNVLDEELDEAIAIIRKTFSDIK